MPPIQPNRQWFAASTASGAGHVSATGSPMAFLKGECSLPLAVSLFLKIRKL